MEYVDDDAHDEDTVLPPLPPPPFIAYDAVIEYEDVNTYEAVGIDGKDDTIIKWLAESATTIPFGITDI